MTNEIPSASDLATESFTLLMGKRGSTGRISANRVGTGTDIDAELRRPAIATVELLGSGALVERRYEPFAELEEGEEFFSVDVGELPERNRARTIPTPGQVVAQAPESRTKEPSALDLLVGERLGKELNHEQLRQGRFQFYALLFDTDPPCAFVKWANPSFNLKTGHRLFRYRDVLIQAEEPDLNLAEDIDLLLTPSRVCILRPVAFERLFHDVKIAFESVDKNSQLVAAVLNSSAPMSDRAQEGLRLACSRRLTFAFRLSQLLEELANSNMDRAALDDYLHSLENRIDRGAIRAGRGFDFGEAEVPMFLDVLEGRLNIHYGTSQLVRADRMSTPPYAQ